MAASSMLVIRGASRWGLRWGRVWLLRGMFVSSPCNLACVQGGGKVREWEEVWVGTW